MTTTSANTPIPAEDEPTGDDLGHAICDYVRTYVLWHGRAKATERFGVSRHTLWRCLERGRLGKSLPRAVIQTVGDAPDVIEAAAWATTAVRHVRRRAAADPKPLAETLEDALRLLCAAPLATVGELSSFGRIPATTLRRRLAKLTERGLADSVAHHLGALGPNPKQRHFPTKQGIETAARVEHGVESFLSEYPASREWFRLLTERLDAVAVLYHVAAVIARADPDARPVRVDHYRQGPYDLLITLSGGRSLGIVRQGPVLSSANLRYRLRTLEQLRYYQRPTATLVLTHSDQATRRAFRTLGDPGDHRSTFVATEGELLAGDAQAQVWQQCGGGGNSFLPETISPDVSLDAIMGWLGRRAGTAAGDRPRPDPEELYPSRMRALMPQPSEQVCNSPAVRLTRAEKQALDLLAAWPLCDTGQLAGLMGGVTRRRANQMLRSLTDHGLIRAEGESLVLTDEGLTCLARRDRSAVRMALGRWSARWRRRRRGGPGLRRHLPAQPGLPTGPPGRHQHRRGRPERRGSPVPGPPPAGAAAHLPFQHRLPLPGRRLCDPPRRRLLAVIPGRLASLPPGVRATRRHPQTGPRPVEELPPLLRQRLGRRGPRRAVAPGAVRVRDPRSRGVLLAGGRGAPPAHLHLQPGDDQRPWRVTRGVALAAAQRPGPAGAAPAGTGLQKCTFPFQAFPVGALCSKVISRYQPCPTPQARSGDILLQNRRPGITGQPQGTQPQGRGHRVL